MSATSCRSGDISAVGDGHTCFNTPLVPIELIPVLSPSKCMDDVHDILAIERRLDHSLPLERVLLRRATQMRAAALTPLSLATFRRLAKRYLAHTRSLPLSPSPIPSFHRLPPPLDKPTQPLHQRPKRLRTLHIPSQPAGQLRLLGRLLIPLVEEDDGGPIAGIADCSA